MLMGTSRYTSWQTQGQHRIQYVECANSPVEGNHICTHYPESFEPESPVLGYFPSSFSLSPHPSLYLSLSHTHIQQEHSEKTQKRQGNSSGFLEREMSSERVSAGQQVEKAEAEAGHSPEQ